MGIVEFVNQMASELPVAAQRVLPKPKKNNTTTTRSRRGTAVAQRKRRCRRWSGEPHRPVEASRRRVIQREAFLAVEDGRADGTRRDEIGNLDLDGGGRLN